MSNIPQPPVTEPLPETPLPVLPPLTTGPVALSPMPTAGSITTPGSVVTVTPGVDGSVHTVDIAPSDSGSGLATELTLPGAGLIPAFSLAVPASIALSVGYYSEPAPVFTAGLRGLRTGYTDLAGVSPDARLAIDAASSRLDFASIVVRSLGGDSAPSIPTIIDSPSAGLTGIYLSSVLGTASDPTFFTASIDRTDFAMIAGIIRVIGGEGDTTLIADAAIQHLFQGPGDDVLYAGGGDDLVGSSGGNDRIYGEDGNDRLFGGEGNDSLDGGTGVDAAMFAGNRRDFAISRNGDGVITVADVRSGSPMGTDSVVNVEIFSFQNGNTLATAPLRVTADKAFVAVDEGFYRASNSDVDAAIRAGQFSSAADHFARFGMAEGRDANAFFNTSWYLAQNADVAAAVTAGTTTAWQHYMNHGWREGRDPSSWFDTSGYLDANFDVAFAGANPMSHFMEFGFGENRLVPSAMADLWVI